MFISAIMNVYNSTNSTDVSVPVDPSVESWFTPTLAVFGSIHFILSLWMVTDYILVNISTFVPGPIWLSKNKYLDWWRWYCNFNFVLKRYNVNTSFTTYSGSS